MFLKDLLLVFTVSGLVVFSFHRLRVPAVVGLLVSGIVVGPHSLSLVPNIERVHLLAEIGVVVLLFTVGLEFSVSRLVAMSKTMWLVGLPQLLLCILVSVAATWWYLGTVSQAVFVGMLVAMSSTAIVLKLLTDRGETTTVHGRIGVAVLLLQDLCVPVFVLLVPLLTPEHPKGRSIWLSLVIGVVAVAAILAAGKYLVPHVLYQIVRTRNRELFLITIFVLCIGTATITALVGLSLALGAFLAGLALSESEFGQQTMAEALPFRDTLSSLFFVSIGMLLDVKFLFNHAPLVIASVLALILLKFASVTLPAILAKYPLRTAVLAGLAVAQIGEFSFVLASKGYEYNLLNYNDHQTLLAAAVLTMGVTPFLIASGPHLIDALGRVPALAWLGSHTPPDTASPRPDHANDHVLVAGYGSGGQILAEALTHAQIPHLFLDTNPDTVWVRRKQGAPILFGDCTRPSVLEHAGLKHARAYLVGISDPTATRRTVQIARQLAPQAHIIARTRHLSEMQELRRLGADHVILEELEATLHTFARLMHQYQMPRDQIEELLLRLRQGHSECPG